MLRYSVKRLFQTIPTLIVISVVVFGLILVVPGDPVLHMLGYIGDDIQVQQVVDQEVYTRMRERLGLDDPLPIQYVRWLQHTVQGDLGTSLNHGVPVLDIILDRIPATFYLGAAALLIGLVIAVPLGIFAAVRRGTWVDHLGNGVVIFGIVTPGFWVALMAVLVFSVHLGWFPSIGYAAPQERPVQFLRHLALPAFVMGIDVAAGLLRYLRADLLEQLRQDYVRAARAKGLPERIVLIKHALKNSLVATVTVLGLDISGLLGGSTIIETMFAYPGISYLLLQSIYARDFPVVQGVVLMMALLVVAVNYLTDIVYAFLNPRIQYT
ncbi:MAG: ABC transporter permease [Candidatus Binatia bacterium]